MGAPRGNKNAVGSKGGGRKSAYEEHQIAKKIIKAFTCGVDKVELAKKLQKKKVKLIDVTIAHAFKDTKVLLKLVDKLFPDRRDIDIKSKGKALGSMSDLLTALNGGTVKGKPTEQGVEDK